MAQSTYTVGQSITAAVAFATKVGNARNVTVSATNQLIYGVEGDLVDPNEVWLVVQDGDGEESVSLYGDAGQPYLIQRDALGVYYASLYLHTPGRWRFRWEGDPGTDEAKVSNPVDFGVVSPRLTLTGAPAPVAP